MNSRTLFSFIFLMVGLVWSTFGQEVIQLNENKPINNFGKQVYLITDTTQQLSINEIIKKNDFQLLDSDVPNLGISHQAYWLKLNIQNLANVPQLALQIRLPTLDYVDFYQVARDGSIVKDEKVGDRRPYYNREFDNPFSTFLFTCKPREITTVYIRVAGNEQLQVPLTLASQDQLQQKNSDAYIIFGVYAGIICVMFVYNLFLYLSTREETYLYYIVYLFFIGLLQANFQGFPFKYLWPENMWLSTHAVYILTPLAALSALEFMRKFLHTKQLLPKHNRIMYLFYIPYSIALLLVVFDQLLYSYQLLQITAIVIAIYMLVIAFKTYNSGYKSAIFFIRAWIVFLLGLCIFVLKDYNILPYNTITYNMMPFGSALEVILLSFALADKINILKKEKEASQEEALRISLENEKLILEQNFELEKKVQERTLELQQSTNALEKTLNELKDAQSQLVESEKMAGLGQLTAGIAHEINNPINFVTANIKPLQLDIDDLNEIITKYESLDLNANVEEQLSAIEKFKKQIDLDFVQTEIKGLLSGIDEGAKRTAEIIRSLKNFSRLDESDTKPINLNEGIDSTFVLLRSTFPSNLKVVKNYGDIPLVECLPGKINQVFMNIISNGIHAIKNKETQREEEQVVVSTWQEGSFVKVSIKDTGSGMSEETKQKIFEPFFTTKDVGEGTGLGLSIVFRIIESHRGNIDVLSNIGEGTEFIITLPVN
jgi:two-component system NtrC family sensor kinase